MMTSSSILSPNVKGCASSTRSVGPLLLAGVVSLALAFCTGGCVMAFPYIVTLEPPLELPKPAETSFAPCNVRLGNLKLVKHPSSWRIREVRRGKGSAEQQIVVVEISGASELGPVGLNVIPGRTLIQEENMAGFPNLFEIGRPSFTSEQFRKKYPSDHALLIACSQLPPGDLARGEKWLDRKEQEEVALGYLSLRMFFWRVPARVRHGPLDAFVSGAVAPKPSNTDQLIVAFRMAVFIDNAPQGVYFTFPRGPSQDVGRTKEMLDEVIRIAVELLPCLEPI